MYNSKEKCKEIAQKFKELCNARGTTPYKVAVQAGLSTSTVSCFLSGKTIPKLDTMLMLCNSLGISITDEYSRAVTPQIRQAGNRLSGLAETAYASLLA